MSGSRPLTDQEIELVLSTLKSIRDRTLLVVGLKTGFRISELLSLKVENVTQYGEIANQITVNRCNMKGKHSSRTVPLHPRAKKALEEYLGQMGNYDLKTKLFPFTRQWAHKILKKAFNEIKLDGKVTTHSLRKSFCQRVHEKLEGDLLKTQAAMGHKSINSTVRYLSFNQQDVTEAILGV